MQELLSHNAIHLCVSIKGYYVKIPLGWVRSQACHAYVKCSSEKSSNCDVWKVIPLCPFPQNSAHTNTLTLPQTTLCDMNLHDLSGPANHIVVPKMTAEPLSLSWLVSVGTHIQKYSYLLQPQCKSSINIMSRWPCGSIFVSLLKMIKWPCDMTVITY